MEKTVGGDQENHNESFSYFHGVYKVTCFFYSFFDDCWEAPGRLGGKPRVIKDHSARTLDDVFDSFDVFGRSTIDMGALWDNFENLPDYFHGKKCLPQ